LGGQSLWFDEGWSWHLAKMPLSEMAVTTAGDRSPPLYYALLHTWIVLGGESEFVMRYISALADTATLALVMAFAQALSSGRRLSFAPQRLSSPALFAGLIYALCPVVIWYAQETRMYALVVALCTASSYFLLKWLQTRSGVRILAASALLLALAVYCHYYAIFLLPAQFVVVVILAAAAHDTRYGISDTLRWLVAAACVVASLVPWLLIASAGFAYDDGFFFPLNTVDGRLLEFVRSFASGGLAVPLPDWWWIALGMAALLGVIGFAANKRGRELLIVLALIAGPLLAATIAVRVVYPNRSVFHPRYLIYVAPMVCVLFGGAFSLSQRAERPCSKAEGKRAGVRERRSWTAVVFGSVSLTALGALWLPPLIGYFTNPALQRDNTRQATKHVVEALASGDAVVMSRDNFAVRYYWPEIWRQSWSADYDPAAGMLVAAPDGLHGILTDDESVLAKLNEAPRKRVRLMLWQDGVVDPQKFVESSLWPNGFELGEYNFAQIRLPLYQIDASPIAPPQFKATDAVFGDQLALRSAWQRERGVAGDWFYTVLNWEPLTQLSKDYKVFVHVLDQDDKLAFQNDKLPLNALLPMTRWKPNQPLRDAHAMVIPADLPAGTYRVVVGVYDPAGQRLLTQDGKDVAELGTVEVTRP
jgi:hypothetical protein